jgi:hypothetical protein
MFPKVVRYGFFDGIPPSDNHLYTNGFKGKRTMSVVGKRVANHLKQALLEQWMLSPQLDHNRPYGLVTVIFLPGLLNRGFGKKGGTDNRFKRLDASNRGKLVEDVVAEMLGVDDSSAFDCLRYKRIGEPHVEVFLYELEDADCLQIPPWLAAV